MSYVYVGSGTPTTLNITVLFSIGLYNKIILNINKIPVIVLLFILFSYITIV